MSDDYLCIAPSADEVAALMDASLTPADMMILRRLAYRVDALQAELDECIKACDEAEADLARMTESRDDWKRQAAEALSASAKRIAELELALKVLTMKRDGMTLFSVAESRLGC